MSDVKEIPFYGYYQTTSDLNKYIEFLTLPKSMMGILSSYQHSIYADLLHFLYKNDNVGDFYIYPKTSSEYHSSDRIDVKYHYINGSKEFESQVLTIGVLVSMIARIELTSLNNKSQFEYLIIKPDKSTDGYYIGIYITCEKKCSSLGVSFGSFIRIGGPICYLSSCVFKFKLKNE